MSETKCSYRHIVYIIFTTWEISCFFHFSSQHWKDMIHLFSYRFHVWKYLNILFTLEEFMFTMEHITKEKEWYTKHFYQYGIIVLKSMYNTTLMWLQLQIYNCIWKELINSIILLLLYLSSFNASLVIAYWILLLHDWMTDSPHKRNKTCVRKRYLLCL